MLFFTLRLDLGIFSYSIFTLLLRIYLYSIYSHLVSEGKEVNIPQAQCPKPWQRQLLREIATSAQEPTWFLDQELARGSRQVTCQTCHVTACLRGATAPLVPSQGCVLFPNLAHVAARGPPARSQWWQWNAGTLPPAPFPLLPVQLVGHPVRGLQHPGQKGERALGTSGGGKRGCWEPTMGRQGEQDVWVSQSSETTTCFIVPSAFTFNTQIHR